MIHPLLMYTQITSNPRALLEPPPLIYMLDNYIDSNQQISCFMR